MNNFFNSTNFNLFMKLKLIKNQILFALFGLISLTALAQNPPQRIVGGYDVNIEDHPYQVRLNVGCGGVILNENWVLTAIHCTEGQSASRIRVRAGISNLRESSGQSVRVKRIVNVRSFSQGDLSLLELSTPLNLSGPKAKAVPYANSNAPVGSTTIVSGWGQTENGFSPQLKAVDLNLSRYTNRGIFIEARGNNKDSCFGDSGGPLVIGNNGNYTLIGIVSHGSPACKSPGFYGNVARAANDIQSITGIAPNSSNPVTPNPTPNPTPTPTPDPTPTPVSNDAPIGQIVGLRAVINNRYVVAENFGDEPLRSNRPELKGWEEFAVVDAQNGAIALRATVNNRYVVAENRGNSALIANRTRIGSWEKFEWVKNSDGTISLKSLINNRYVTASATGGNLIANATSIGTAQKFRFETVERSRYAKRLASIIQAIWPNPVTDILNVDTSAPVESLSVYDLTGKLVATSQTTQINLSNLEDGTYMLVVNGEKSFSKQIIKK